MSKTCIKTDVAATSGCTTGGFNDKYDVSHLIIHIESGPTAEYALLLNCPQQLTRTDCKHTHALRKWSNFGAK